METKPVLKVMEDEVMEDGEEVMEVQRPQIGLERKIRLHSDPSLRSWCGHCEC